MRVRIQHGRRLGLVVVDVDEQGTVAEMLESTRIPTAFDQLTILERHAGEIGTRETIVLPGERYYIMTGLSD